MAAATAPQISGKELVELGALDSEFYCRTFFPMTFRQKTPLFHKDLWGILEDRTHTYVAIMVFRGGAKTTSLRAFASKRIAYGVSRTILFVSESQEHSRKSLQWLRRQVERNKLWTQVFGLSRGSKWTDELIEIYHAQLDITITVIAAGITGQIRGTNIDDWRPDLIVVDDPCNEENTGTPEQRAKLRDLFFGALQNSLTPFTEAPDAKMALLQTPLHEEDLINTCHKDPTWASRSFGCFNEAGESRWEERFPKSFLQDKKTSFADKGILKLWMREMENLIIGSETALFQKTWIKYWDVLPDKLTTYLAIDPVPPPSDREIGLGLAKKDYEVLSVIGCQGGNYYLLDYSVNRGHTPEWTATEFFRLVDKWKPMKVRVEGVAYQRTLKWILEQKMKERGRYVQIDAPSERRRKIHRIAQAYSGIASNGAFFIHPTHLDFEVQFLGFPNLAHDDILDATAMAIDAAQELEIYLDQEIGLTGQEESLVASLSNWRSAP